LKELKVSPVNLPKLVGWITVKFSDRVYTPHAAAWAARGGCRVVVEAETDLCTGGGQTWTLIRHGLRVPATDDRARRKALWRFGGPTGIRTQNQRIMSPLL
jgi:hypothetical protein